MPIPKQINIRKKIKKISKYILSDKSKIGGDIDILDSKHLFRKTFLNNIKFKKSLISTQYHRTGVRYDLIDNMGKIISLDFLNGKEKNPLFFNLYKKKNKKLKKINTNEININFFSFFLIFINIIKYLNWRIRNFFKQPANIIEIFGIDGAGKSFLADKLSKKLDKMINVKIYHLWTFRNKNSVKSQIPYKYSNYVYPISLVKEIYIVIRVIILIANIFVFSKKKDLLIFERSVYDIVIDPNRYRLAHKPIFLIMIYKFFFKDTKKIYLNISYNLSKKRKNEISNKKYTFLKYKLDKLFKDKKMNKYYLFHNLIKSN